MRAARWFWMAALGGVALVAVACSATAPVADFTTGPLSGPAPLSVQFTDTSLNDPISWAWDFGDGVTAAEQSPQHLYQQAGTFDVVLDASNDAGSHSVTKTALVTVDPGPLERLRLSEEVVTVVVGEERQLTVQALDAFDNEIPGVQVAWTARLAGSVTQDGLFQAGTDARFFPADLEATVRWQGETLRATVDVTLVPGAVATVEVSASEQQLAIGDTASLIVKAVDGFGNPIAEPDVSWSVDGDTHQVNQVGQVIAGTETGELSAFASVTAGGETVVGAAMLTVLSDPLAALSLTPATAEVPAGEPVVFAAVPVDQYGNVIAGLGTEWRILSEGGAVDGEGGFNAVTLAGDYGPTVEAAVTQGELTLTASAIVTVVPAALSQVVLGPPTVALGIGMEQQYVAIAGDRFGNRIPEAKLAWSVVDGGGAVDASGLFTAGSIPDTYADTVQVEAAQSGVTQTAMGSVTVEPERVAFISDRDEESGEIYIMDVDGSNVRSLTFNGATEFLYSWSPDGRRIAYDAFALDGGVFLTGDDGAWTVQVALNTSTLAHLYPAWSPDGRELLFVQWDLTEDNRDIYVMEVDGGVVTQVTNTPAADEFVPTWSPDGSMIVYDFTPDGENGFIYVAEPDGTGTQQLTTNTANDTSPVWSPDGTQVLFTSVRDGDDELYVMNADGTDIRQLTANTASDYGGSWSPDGSRIVFASDRDGNFEIYTIAAQGGDLVRLTNNDVRDFDAKWASLKTGLAVTEESLVLTNASPPADQAIADVSAAVRAAVVRIETDLGLGSGFIIDTSGLVVTNNHVISDAETLTVFLDDGQELSATVVGRDLVRDLAVLQISAEDPLPAVTLASVGGPTLGEQVVVMGFPLGTPDLSVALGLVSSLKDDGGRNIFWVQTDAAVNPGNSGGPMFNLRGEVIGVVSAKLVDVTVEGVGFAISAETVQNYLARLKAGETIGQER